MELSGQLIALRAERLMIYSTALCGSMTDIPSKDGRTIIKRSTVRRGFYMISFTYCVGRARLDQVESNPGQHCRAYPLSAVLASGIL